MIKEYQSIKIKLSEINLNEYNPKKGFDSDETKRQFEDLKKSMKANGYLMQIIVRENEEGKFEVVDGEHRYLALKELGIEEIKVTNLGKLTREQAIKKTLNIEKIKIPLDEIMTAELLKELSLTQDIESLSQDVPFSVDEITNKLKLLEFDFDAMDEIDEASEDGSPKFSIECSKEYLIDIKKEWARLNELFQEMSEEALLLACLKSYGKKN